MLDLQQWFFEFALQPIMLRLDLTQYLEDAFAGSVWFCWGLVQLLLIVCLLEPLQRWRPAQPVTDRATVRVDIFYTLLHRLGLFRVLVFFSVEPWLTEAFGVLRSGDAGAFSLGTFHLDQFWPGVSDLPAVSFLIYLVVFDALAYLVHRAQHAWRPWWALHSLHHAQQQMTVWSDNRNHLLDDLVRDSLWICLAFLIGVSPGQFVLLVVFTQLLESLQHANVRLHFGRVGERLLVSPRFHRLHHSAAHGFGHNFGVLFPWWDVWFGTAFYADRYDPTGTGDQPAVNYGRGFWEQQILGVRRMAQAIKEVLGL